MTSMISRLYRTTVLCSACLVLPSAVWAETASRAPTGLEEVVVTAQKRAENLQDVPISVAAFGQVGEECHSVARFGVEFFSVDLDVGHTLYFPSVDLAIAIQIAHGCCDARFNDSKLNSGNREKSA